MGQTTRGRDRERGKFRRGLTAALLEYARQRFALGKIDPKTNKSRLQTMIDIRTQTGVVRKELREMRSLPPETAYLWEWYEALSQRRGASMSVNAISWADMWAFFQLRGISPQPWEVDTICQLDTAYLLCQASDAPQGAVQGAGDLQTHITGKRDGKR